MPRIDPLQLLKCLSVLLTPEGGILSKEEVPRLVNLMTKFSKKLVSKCVYILILKNTERSLVNMFMAEGGWNLIHTWLQDAIQISNWDLVKEIVSLLLITPVDVERLKMNTIPKLVKSLTRVENCKGVQELSSQLVQDWLTIVKSNTVHKVEPCQPIEHVTNEIKTVDINSVNKIQGSVDLQKQQQQKEQQLETVNNNTVDSSEITGEAAAKNDQEAVPTSTFYKVTVRDGKQVISRAQGPENEQNETKQDTSVGDTVKLETKDKKDEKSLKSKSSSSSSSSKTSSSKHSSSSSKSSKSSSSSSSSKDKHRSSSSKSSSRDKDRDRKDRDKYKHKSNGSKHSSSSSSSSSSNKEKPDSKEKQAEKDKDTLAKIKPQSLDKLGRIPKKTDDNKPKEIKKSTMSIEVRKATEERPKTVKVYNSKRRSTGLEDEAKPAPPRPIKKQATPATVSITAITTATTTTATPSIIPPPKRQSPIRDLPGPPEKKLKIDIPPPIERPGSIKLIPPKPKPPVLQESDIFMDALTASATTKKEQKKRKRRASVTKDTPSSPTTKQQESETSTSPISSPLGLKNIAAPNFYQDTLNTTENNEDDEDDDDDRVERGGGNTPTQNEEVEEKRSIDGLRGALVYTKRKGPKKSVRFNDNDLTQVRFFELDETERVNVTKTFMDMAKMEMTNEREAFQLSRKLSNEDTMEVQTNWRVPYLIDIPDQLVIPGCKSLEKDIQFAREKTALQALYFDKRKIPDSPEEPITEHHQIRDPIIIPLEDSETQEMDLRNTPWPEPKGSPPPPLIQETNLPPQIFNNIPMPFQNFPNGPPQPFQGLPPRFQIGQGGPPPQPNIFGPPNMLPNGNILGPPNIGGPQHDLLQHQGPLNPNAFGPGPGPDFNPMMNDNFPLPFNPPNMGMYPPNNFNMNRSGNHRGGGFRRNGGGGGGGGGNNGRWVQLNNGPGNWNNRGPSNNRSGGGGGGNNGRVCKNIKNHGFCRNMDKCQYVHPK